MPAPRTSSVLKIIHGTATPKRMRNDEPAVGKPEWSMLCGDATADELAAFAELARCMPKYTVGEKDGHLLSQAARLYVRLRHADLQLAKSGMLMRGPNGIPVSNPYFRIARQTRAELHIVLQQLGLGPLSRLRLATTDTSRKLDAASWDEFET